MDGVCSTRPCARHRGSRPARRRLRFAGRACRTGRPAVRRLLSQPTSAKCLASCTAGVMAGRVAADRAPTIYPEMGINSPHLGFTVPANSKVLITPTRDSPLWPPYFRQTAAGILGRAPHRAPAVFFRPTGRARRRGSMWEPSFFAGFALRCAVAGAAFPDGLDPDDPIHRPESCLRPG